MISNQQSVCIFYKFYIRSICFKTVSCIFSFINLQGTRLFWFWVVEWLESPLHILYSLWEWKIFCYWKHPSGLAAAYPIQSFVVLVTLHRLFFSKTLIYSIILTWAFFVWPFYCVWLFSCVDRAHNWRGCQLDTRSGRQQQPNSPSRTWVWPQILSQHYSFIQRSWLRWTVCTLALWW